MQFNLNVKEKEKSRVYLTCIWHLMGMCCYHCSAWGLFVPTSSGSRQGIVKWFQFMVEMGTTSWPKRKWKILRYSWRDTFLTWPYSQDGWFLSTFWFYRDVCGNQHFKNALFLDIMIYLILRPIILQINKLESWNWFKLYNFLACFFTDYFHNLPQNASWKWLSYF